MWLEGKHAIAEALRAQMPLKQILFAEGVDERSVREIERLATEAGLEARRVPRRQLDANSERGAHQGVMAEAAPFRFAPLDKVVKAAAGRPQSLIFVLDHLTDPGNLGAIARTAEVAGADGIVVPSRRSAAITPAAWKAAAGAFAHVPVVQETNLVRALERLKGEGYWVAGAWEGAPQTVWEAPLEGRLAVVMGSEGKGLARLTRENCDFLVRLPQAGKVGSLNVAQAATAIAYEWMRRGSTGRSDE